MWYNSEILALKKQPGSNISKGMDTFYFEWEETHVSIPAERGVSIGDTHDICKHSDFL